MVTQSGPILFVNRQGIFQEYASFLLPGRHSKALWVDVDHDHDLDLFLFGQQSMLLRNNGKAGFSDHSRQFPFLPGEALDASLYDLIRDREVIDLVVSYRDRPVAIYQDRLFGRYDVLSLSQDSAGTHSILAYDVNNDGWTDLVAVSDSEVFFSSTERAGWRRSPSMQPKGNPFFLPIWGTGSGGSGG